MENLFTTHSKDRTYQRILLNEHHQKNYKNSLLNHITHMAYNAINMLRLKILEDFPAKWLNVRHETERKLVNLLLEETKLVHQDKTVAQRCSVTKVSLQISQNSQKNTCARVSF